MNEKYRNAVHYIIDKCENPYKLGSIKLNKILLFTDGILLRKTGKTLTEDTYIKRQFGPVPKNILKILNGLKNDNIIAIRDGKKNNDARLFFSLREPDISNLSSTEIDALYTVTMFIYKKFKVKEISDITHQPKIWDYLNIGDEVDLYSYFISEEAEITKEDINWALSVKGIC